MVWCIMLIRSVNIAIRSDLRERLDWYVPKVTQSVKTKKGTNRGSANWANNPGGSLGRWYARLTNYAELFVIRKTRDCFKSDVLSGSSREAFLGPITLSV